MQASIFEAVIVLVPVHWLLARKPWKFFTFSPPFFAPPHFYCFPSTTTTTTTIIQTATPPLPPSSDRHTTATTIILTTTPPQPPPHFYCFPSTTTSAFLFFPSTVVNEIPAQKDRPGRPPHHYYYYYVCLKISFAITFTRSSHMRISLCFWKQGEFLWQCKGWYAMYTRPLWPWRLYWREMSG